MIHFIDARTGENMTEIGTRDWPSVPEVGDELVFTNPVKKCRVVSATWIDLVHHRDKLITKIGLEELPKEP
jgi:hypothetical protein